MGIGQDDVDLGPDQLGRKCRQTIKNAVGSPALEVRVLAVDIAEIVQFLHERVESFILAGR